MYAFLSTYSDVLGMTPASFATSIFGAFIATFAVIICWPKLVKQYGPVGGIMCAAFLIGSFWLLNHKLPGFGFYPDQIKDEAGHLEQFGLINQAFYGASPWVDMGLAIFTGFWVHCLVGTPKGKRSAAVKESLHRMGWAIFGGIVGGALTGFIGFSGAKLFN